MLCNRIQPKIYKLLRRNQNWFRSTRSTTSQILAVSRIIEGVKEHNPEPCIICDDFSKAFNSIDKISISEILKAYGIPMKIIKANTTLYTNTKSLRIY